MLSNKTNFYWHGKSNDDKNISKYKDTRMIPLIVSNEVIENAYNFMEAIDTHLAKLNTEDIFAHKLQYQQYKQLCKAVAVDILKDNPEHIVIADEQLWILPIYILKEHRYAHITILFQKDLPSPAILDTLPYWEKAIL
jgi:trehalose-6-phosphate synthase